MHLQNDSFYIVRKIDGSYFVLPAIFLSVFSHDSDLSCSVSPSMDDCLGIMLSWLFTRKSMYELLNTYSYG